MKFLPCLMLFAGVTACNSHPSLTSEQKAVTAYLNKTLDDPASYQPVSWGSLKTYSRAALAQQQAGQERLQYQVARSLEKTDSIRYQLALQDKLPPHYLDRIRIPYEQARRKSDSIHALVARYAAVGDTTLAFRAIRHTFRAKNKMGALVLDSAQFQIAPTGAISVTKI